MNWKTITGTISLGGLMGLAALTGSVLLQPAAAQTSQPTQTAQATATPAPSTPGTGVPTAPDGIGRGFGGPGGRGGHGDGLGGLGGDYSTDGASRAISLTTDLLNLAKSDVTYATGKMDTAKVQDWLNQADTLINTAETASVAGEYGRAVETAGAARHLISAAEALMQQALGAANLPSYSERPFPGKGGIGAGSATGITQAHASRDLAAFYNAIVAQESQLSSVGNTGNAANYLAAAKDAYRTAYTAYQAGNYDEAHGSTAVGRSLLGAAGHLVRAATAPKDANTPVQVPAPNF